MYTTASYTTIATPAAAPKSVSIFALIGKMIALHKQRKALAEMDDAQLQDLGLSYADAQIEASRPFWDLPANWAA